MSRITDIGLRGNTWIVVAPSGPFWIGLAYHEEDAFNRAATEQGFQSVTMPDILVRKAKGWYAAPAAVTWQAPPPFRAPPKLQARTFIEWRDLGYTVILGQKHTGRNLAGECTFQPNQVTRITGYTGNNRKYREVEEVDLEESYELADFDPWWAKD